mmetsp:Transcript_51989/g.143948  ORF Transcript_51989/g.143948 Transcript_51989/m.143948 type:complete len:253 (+) Transcript_51989:542-1300(+)
MSYSLGTPSPSMSGSELSPMPSSSMSAHSLASSGNTSSSSGVPSPSRSSVHLLLSRGCKSLSLGTPSPSMSGSALSPMPSLSRSADSLGSSGNASSAFFMPSPSRSGFSTGSFSPSLLPSEPSMTMLPPPLSTSEVSFGFSNSVSTSLPAAASSLPLSSPGCFCGSSGVLSSFVPLSPCGCFSSGGCFSCGGCSSSCGCSLSSFSFFSMSPRSLASPQKIFSSAALLACSQPSFTPSLNFWQMPMPLEALLH